MRRLRQSWFRLLPLIAVLLVGVATPRRMLALEPGERRCVTSLCRFQTIQAALKTNPSDPTAKLELAEYYADRGQIATAYEKIREMKDVGQRRPEVRLLTSELAWKLGRKLEATQEYEKLESEPISPTLKLRLAKDLAELGFAERALTLAESAASSESEAAAWESVLEFATKVQDHTAQERAQIALRKLGGGSPQKGSVSAFDELKQAELDFLTPFNSNWTRELPPATRMLADTRVDRVGADGLLWQHTQQWIQAGQSAPLPETGIQEIKYSPRAETVQLLAARLHKRSGDVVLALPLEDAAAQETTAGMYYGLRKLRVQFAGAEPGDVMELEYRVTPKQDELLNRVGQIVSFNTAMPTLLKRYTVLALPGAKPHFSFERVAQPKLASVQGIHATTWEARDLAPVASEPRGPATAEIAGYVGVSQFTDWQQLGTWYANAVREQFELTPELRQRVKELAGGANDDLGRIKAIQQFVMQNTHYVALELGAHTYKPYRVSDVYARKFGDCKDKASLLVAMLRAAGIEADLALVRTQKLGAIAPDVAALAAFNHAIVYIPKQEIWIDATADYGAINELPTEDQGAMALTVSGDGRAELRRIPQSSPEDNATQRRIAADVRADGTVSFRANQFTRGEEASVLRRELEVPDRQRDSLQRGLAEAVPSVQVNEVQVSRGDRDRVNIDFGGEVNTYRGKKEVALSNTWYARRYVRTLAPLLSRTQDVVINTPLRTDEELRFALPVGARVRAHPAEFVRNTQFGSASIRYETLERMLVLHSSVEIRKARITPGEYAAFREFCAAVDNAFRQQVSITLP